MTTTARATSAPPPPPPAAARARRRSVRMRTLAPYWLVLPGWLWLAIFFVVPIVDHAFGVDDDRRHPNGFKQTFHWSNYSDAWTATTFSSCARSSTA